MNKIAHIFLLARLAVSLCAQVPDYSCCELTAKVDVAPPVGMSVTLTIVVKNVSADLAVVEWGGNDEVRFAVLKEDGQEAERTEQGKRLLTKELSGSMRSRELGRDATFEQAVDLAEFYVLKPGVYTVIVIRKIVVKDVRIPFTTKATFTIP
jgi:hypothetical protein